jgi:phage FluMu protein Com
MPPEKTLCAACHGTGQWTFFGGVSRFFFTVEECPECAGLGFILAPEEEPATTRKSTKSATKPQPTRRKK